MARPHRPFPTQPSDRAALILATWFGAGLAPRAPGTVGTLATMPLAVLFCGWPVESQLALLLVMFPLGVAAAHRAGRHYGVADAGQIVVDESIGLLVTLLGLPGRWQILLAGFLLFRLCDIVKPWPASFFDRRVKNGFGVVMDDVVAGAYARLLLTLLGLLWPGWFGSGLQPLP